MNAESGGPPGPDLAQGIEGSALAEGRMIAGRVGNEAVLLARVGGEPLAVSGTCTHYGAPLADGVLEGATVHCPWHHACFALRSGEALSAPALRALQCWKVEQQGSRLRVSGVLPAAPTRPIADRPGQPAAAEAARANGLSRGSRAIASRVPQSIVIVGGGAAGLAAAGMLRERGYDGRLTMLSEDADAPYDRPNLSKDYLAGHAPEEWIPLRTPEYFRDQQIDLVLGARVTALDLAARRAMLEGAASHDFDVLLLATGAEPVRLRVPGGQLPHVHYLRSLADSRAILGKLAHTRRVVVLGASFIGLEVAAALRARDLDVQVVAPERAPLEPALGTELGRFVHALHEQHGVGFHLGQTATGIQPDAVLLADGTRLPADLVIVGIGVRPRVDLAERAGLAVGDGVRVDEYLRTSAEGVFAAGDIACWPDPHSGPIRVEHWVVAERQGQIAARNMLGERVPCRFAPFFWSQHYDVQISCVGRRQPSDRADVAGTIGHRDCLVAYRRDGFIRAVASIGRDRSSLYAELALEREDQAALEALLV